MRGFAGALTGPPLVDAARRASHDVSAPDARWDVLLLCVAGYLLTSVGRIHQLFPVVGVLRPAMLTGVIATGLYLASAEPERRGTCLLVPTSKYLAALLAWMIVCLPSSLVLGNSLDLLVDNFIKTVLMYFVIAGAVRGIRDVERLVAVYFLAAVIYAAVVMQRFHVGATDWRLDDLYYYDANDFATFVVTAIPFGFYFLCGEFRLLSRLAAAAGLGALTIGLVRSGSRGGFVGLLAVVAFILLFYRDIRPRWRVLGTGLVVLGILGTASDRYWEQMGTIMADSDYNRTEESGRLEIWERGLTYMLDHPLFGVGANNFSTAEGTLSPFAERQQFGIGVRWNAPHNSFVQVGAELGFPGLILFVALIGSAFSTLSRAGRRHGRSVTARRGGPPLARALTASLFGFVVGASFLSLAYGEMLYTLVAFAVGLRKLDDAGVTRASPNGGDGNGHTG
jgi:O-antigen ligase